MAYLLQVLYFLGGMLSPGGRSSPDGILSWWQVVTGHIVLGGILSGWQIVWVAYCLGGILSPVAYCLWWQIMGWHIVPGHNVLGHVVSGHHVPPPEFCLQPGNIMLI